MFQAETTTILRALFDGFLTQIEADHKIVSVDYAHNLNLI